MCIQCPSEIQALMFTGKIQPSSKQLLILSFQLAIRA